MQICGEHKESGILRHGFYASPFSQEADLIQAESQVKERHKGDFAARFIKYVFAQGPSFSSG